MNEINIGKETQAKIANLFSSIKQIESQIILLIDTYVEASGETGKWQLTQDLTKLVKVEESIEVENEKNI